MPCLQNFSTKEILNNHRNQCLLINGCQANLQVIINKYPFFLKYMLTQNAFLKLLFEKN